jgi:hypothetical protein
MLAFLLVRKIVNEANISIAGLYEVLSNALWMVQLWYLGLPQAWIIVVFTENKIR